jgi:hypothetical protein
MEPNVCNTCTQELESSLLAIHHLLCASFTSLEATPPNRVLALLFPVDEPTPRPVHVKLTSATDEETSISFQSIDVTPFFSSSGGEVGAGTDTKPETATGANAATEVELETLYTERNPVRNRDTASMLEIWVAKSTKESSAKSPSLAPNACIQSLNNGKPNFHSWNGPVVALAMTRATGFMVDPGAYRDVSLGDARDVADFLLDYGNPVHGARLREALGSLSSGRVDELEADDGDGEGEAQEDGEGKSKNSGSKAAAPMVFEI